MGKNALTILKNTPIYKFDFEVVINWTNWCNKRQFAVNITNDLEIIIFISDNFYTQTNITILAKYCHIY